MFSPSKIFCCINVPVHEPLILHGFVFYLFKKLHEMNSLTERLSVDFSYIIPFTKFTRQYNLCIWYIVLKSIIERLVEEIHFHHVRTTHEGRCCDNLGVVMCMHV